MGVWPVKSGKSGPPSGYDFKLFYARLKERGFVIYPGKVTGVDTFRIGNIGHVFPADIAKLIAAVNEAMYWRKP